MSNVEERTEVEAVETKEEQTFKFEQEKVSDKNSQNEVTLTLSEKSSYLAQAKDAEKSKEVIEEIGRYQKQLNDWAVTESAKLMNDDKVIQKVKVKQKSTKLTRGLAVSVTAVRERQIMDKAMPYVSSAITSDQFSKKDEMKSLRERLAKEL
jgi:hypothetical protein